MRSSNLLHLYSIIYTVSAQSPYKQKTIEVLENTPVDTDLFNLNKFYSDGIKRRFSVQQTKNTLIAVDDLGNVKLSSHVDYESLCSSNPCTIDQMVMVMPQDVYERISIKLQILNENDNRPHFQSSEVHISVPEGHLIGQRIEVPELVARDDDFETQLVYSLSGNSKFKIESDKNRVYLLVDDILDYETNCVEYVTVRVEDGHGLNAETELVVSILDQNDAAPEFQNIRTGLSQNFYEIEINEINERETLIYQIQASDEDSGKNGQVSYEIVQVQPPQAQGLFKIDPDDGKITNNAVIQRHDFHLIKLTILASDGGAPALSSEAQLTITILDSNDHTPTVSLTPCLTSENDDQVAIIMENEPAGTFAIWYFVEDLDLDQNGLTTVSIQPENLFELRKDDGLIVTRATFDREIRDTYELTVTACDKGIPKRCGVEKMKIKIGDKNDNSPIMAEKRINVSFREDLEIGTKLFQVNAIDHDEPAGYGEITYRLENPNSYYRMDSKTGEVFIEHGFDYETEKSDEFTIIAEDVDGQSDFTVVYVTIINTNDNVPELNIPESVYLQHNYDISQPILNITATDADGVQPVLSLGGDYEKVFKLIGTELYVTTNFTKGFETTVRIYAADGEDLNSRVYADLIVSTKSNLSPLVAGIISGVLIFLLALGLVVLKTLMARKHYKFNYASIKRSESNRDDIIKSDFIVKTGGGSDDASSSDRDSACIIKIETEESMKHCSDSGRGDSGEEESILVIHDRSSNLYGSKYCTEDCYRLGHSDACWLPVESDFGIDVTSKTTNQTNLSVCDRTSDYSSQKSIANNISSREVIV